jgi:hypothetical protein
MQPDTTTGHYTILSALGNGGMGAYESCKADQVERQTLRFGGTRDE